MDPVSNTKKSLFGWIAGGLSAAVVVTAVTLALWPASAEDTARADGERVGQAVSDLYYAQSADEVDAAKADLTDAVADSRDHATSEVSEQVDKQADALDRAADGFVGSRTSDNEFDADLYQSELDYALDDLASNADNFRTHGPEVVQAFWDGVDSGLAVD
jgi:gas vesicle protein